jgi:hypothetical protein
MGFRGEAPGGSDAKSWDSLVKPEAKKPHGALSGHELRVFSNDGKEKNKTINCRQKIY